MLPRLGRAGYLVQHAFLRSSDVDCSGILPGSVLVRLFSFCFGNEHLLIYLADRKPKAAFLAMAPHPYHFTRAYRASTPSPLVNTFAQD